MMMYLQYFMLICWRNQTQRWRIPQAGDSWARAVYPPNGNEKHNSALIYFNQKEDISIWPYGDWETHTSADGPWISSLVILLIVKA